MTAKVVGISEVDQSKLFEARQWTLGDQKGKYVVIDDDLILGIYEDEERAKSHASNLNDCKTITLDDLTAALNFANQITKKD